MALQDDINNFTSSCTAPDLINLAAQTSCTTTNRMVYVDTVNDLPDLANDLVTPGTVFFVNSLSIPVVAQVGCWTGLDNRELRSDYLLSVAYAWGRNTFGEAALNVGQTCSPIAITGNLNKWAGLSVGRNHSIGVTTDGAAWAWGRNSYGQLGDNCTINRSSPVLVVGGFTDWCQVAAGGCHNIGLRTNGTIWAWGHNSYGRLGNNTTISYSSPASVVGGFTDWCQVSAGRCQTLALRTNCTAWTWGRNNLGQLGDGTTIARSSPVSVVGGFTDWCQVATGSYHGLGVRCNGTAWAWGNNNCGQLGDNDVATCNRRSSPVSVVGGFTDWCHVSAGGYHSIGLRSNGTVWTWGRNVGGALGIDSSTDTGISSPVSVVGGFTDWCQVSAGNAHILGLRTNGTAWAWGSGNYGLLGDGFQSNRSSPVSVVGGFTDWCQVSAGLDTSIGLRSF